MRFIPIIVFLFSFNCFCSEEDHLAEVSNYRCWLAMSAVASVIQSIPQAFELGYVGALANELKATNFNTTAGWAVTFATTSSFSNAVAVLSALSLAYRSATLDMTPSLRTPDIRRRRLVELAYAVKAVSSMGMQATATYFLYVMYPSVSSPSLLPALITSAVSLGISMMPMMGSIALTINSCIQRRGGYTELPSV